MGPADCEHVVSAVSHVGPHGVRANPEPADKYDLVVIGAGVAGLLSVIVAKVGTKPKKRMDRTDAEGGKQIPGRRPQTWLFAGPVLQATNILLNRPRWHRLANKLIKTKFNIPNPEP